MHCDALGSRVRNVHSPADRHCAVREVGRPFQAGRRVDLSAMTGVTLYEPDGSGGWQSSEAGDLLPFVSWPIAYLFLVYTYRKLNGETVAPATV